MTTDAVTSQRTQSRARQAAAERLQAERRDVRQVMTATFISVAGTGFALLLLLEVIANTSFINEFLRNPTRPLVEQFHFDIGIKSADVTVVVTALLVLVATLNVALAAFLIKDDDVITGSIKAFTWATVAAFVGRAAGAISLALAVTRITNDFALAAVLIVLTIMTVVLAGSITPRERLPQLTLRGADLEIRLQSNSDALHRFDRRLVERRSRRKHRGPVAFAGRSLVVAVPLAVVNTAFFVAVAGVADFNEFVRTTPDQWLRLLLWVSYALGFYLFLFIWGYTYVRVTQLALCARMKMKLAKLVGAGYWAMAAGLFFLFVFTSPDKSPLTWLLTAGLTVLPAAIVWAASALGSMGGPSLRAHYAGLAYSLLTFRADDLRRSIAANDKAFDAAQTEIRALRRSGTDLRRRSRELRRR